MRKLLLVAAAFLFCTGKLLAQKTVTGKVTDENGNPIPNVSVIIKETNSGTSTKADGTYSLSVPAEAKTIVCSAINFLSAEITIGSQTFIITTLKKENTTLSEVVVVGYGTKSAREINGSISKIDGGKIASTPLPTFDQALAGKTAGVQINATGGIPGDGVAIRIRGINSISNSSQPLVVVDGVPQIAISNTNGFNSGDGTRFNPFMLINPNDIESVEILKDAGAGAIYGSRASNGVILITTKKGKKGTSQVTAEMKHSWARASKLPEMLNGDQFISISNEKATNKYGSASPNAIIAKESDIDGDGQNDRTNWMDLLYRTGKTSDYSVSMSGGTEKASFFGSGRYIKQEGISLNNKVTTGQVRLNIDVTPNTWFKSGVEVSYSKTLNNGILSDRYSAGSTVGWQAFPTISAYNPAGPVGYNLRTSSPIGILNWGNNVRSAITNNFSQYNPVAAAKLGRNDNTADEMRGNIYGELQFIKGLKLTSKFGVQYINNLEDQYNSPYTPGLGNPYNALVQDQDQHWKVWDWQNYLTFDRSFADHKIGFVAGMEYQKNSYNYLYTGAANFSDPFFQYIIDNAYTNVQPGTTTTLNLTGGDKKSSGVESYFGRLNYAYKGKYTIEGSLRRDSYSGFGEDSKWGTFPGISAGWEISKESFMQNIKHLDYLKLRGSYGKVGNYRGVEEYASRALYGGAVYTTSTGLGNTQVASSQLRWESSKKLDIGAEANFYNNRLGLIVDYFNTNIDGLILNAPVLSTVGVPGNSIVKNIGGMKNSGIEITVNGTPMQTKDFSWNISVNFTDIKNKVTGLVPDNGNADITSGFNVAKVGRPLGIFFLPNWKGVDPTTGLPEWYAANGTVKRYNYTSTGGTWTDDHGNPVAALGTADYVYQSKSGLPKWYGGLENTFRYKDLDLSFSLIFQGGNYIYNNTRAILLSNSFLNNSTEILNRWTTPGQKTDIPKLWLIDNTANNASTRFLEKGDFLRMRTIAIGYNIPGSIINRIGFKNIRFYTQILNAFTITKYSGADPEVNTNRFNNISVGTDLRNVPQPRTVLVGLQAGF